MTTLSGTSTKRLLGTSVRFESNVTEALHRFDVCYHAFQEAAFPAEEQLEIALMWDDGTHRVTVSNRPTQEAEDFVTAFRAMNHELLHAVMRSNPQWFYLHAGVVTVGETAIVLPGLSGAGKSTLVLALVERGARFLSDELLVFDPETRLALPFPRAPKIRDVCLRWFPERAADFVGHGEGRFLPLAALHEGVGSKAVVKTVIFPRWSPTAPTQSDVLRGGRLILALTSSVMNFGTHRERSIDHLASLASGVKGLEVTWNDPHQAAATIVEFVS